MIILGVLILIAAIAVLAFGLGWPPHPDEARSEPEKPKRSALTADEILDQRYARGEINREQYLEMRNVLSQ